MKARLAATAAVLLSSATPSFAHRLDEYLQATTLSIGKDRVRAEVRLAPGVAVFPLVLAEIDRDSDGLLSEAELRAYANRVLRELSLTIDGKRVDLRLVSLNASSVQEMAEGLGEIRIELDGNVPRGGNDRRLELVNHHESGISAYLVNCLVPTDPDLRIAAQSRNYEQSFYRLDYVEAGIPSQPLAIVGWWALAGWLATTAVVLLVRSALLRRRCVRPGSGTPAPGPAPVSWEVLE